jgi:protoporphyrinogen oxidase
MIRRIAILGGGPGGLMTAYQLQQHCATPFEITMYEGSARLGGKVLTSSFERAPVMYEAGAAELYNYSHLGDDPLLELAKRLGLKAKPMAGASVIVNDQTLATMDDVGSVLGMPAQRALTEFDTRARRWCSPQEFYDADWADSTLDPMVQISFEDELKRVPDATARQFIRTLVHSDLATEPHETSAAYGLQNYLMNDPAYLTLYTLEGGIEGLVRELAARVTTKLRLRERVTAVEPALDGALRVVSRVDGRTVAEEYDYVVAALPNNYLPSIAWGGALAEPMHRHHLQYDYPAHYLRVSMLFREPFWQGLLDGSYVMLDAFGGCCLYDESSRGDCGGFGVLGWLLAGDAAMNASNLSDAELFEQVLDSLPGFLQHGRTMLVEGHVHRWIGAVNGLPGGRPMHDVAVRHTPVPAVPNLMVVGDYLFDSTLNGVLDSADYVAEVLTERMGHAAEVSVAAAAAVVVSVEV